MSIASRTIGPPTDITSDLDARFCEVHLSFYLK
jgi:hypothetical protein